MQKQSVSEIKITLLCRESIERKITSSEGKTLMRVMSKKRCIREKRRIVLKAEVIDTDEEQRIVKSKCQAATKKAKKHNPMKNSADMTDDKLVARS